ncbi:UvrD-helicase domain-containing protein (plasmid) [Hymenobacter sp. BRD128]|uniref:3'-5' exonuclease n=1 Tax=Hymenobacter sp. BRD128 TaxID=2675878 RepID=UPI00156668D7|nr:3'-5' exonuclease [Hymenobacter sp. BRD128]QKG59116.1 UvrD-helicase domain-containing protein [Hymenobacter sp. BRD128]
MNITPEQAAIVASTGDIKINAVAGSGKTTTLIEYARAQPATARGLYLAFNRTVKLEARTRFAAQGLHNVQVETAHSLAYAHVVKNSRYRVLQAGSYKSHELVDVLGLPSSQEGHEEYVLASHINKFLTYFCNSDKAKVSELNYRDIVWEAAAKVFVERHYAAIERGCRRLLARMESAEIEITHDFYLKKFQLKGPQLTYDYILFDEAQDASGPMLALFLEQRATKIMVGDAHQQIYAWRHAINSLDRADFPSYPLTTSFRFGVEVATLATQVLDYKAALGAHAPVELSGLGTSTATTTKAVIGRSNLALLLKAIEYISGENQVQRLYFEGNINSYTYADEGASLYDVLHLYNGRSAAIKDPLIRKMANLDELLNYARQTEDAQLLMLISIVEDYGNSVIDLIKELKRRQVSDGERHRAQVYFSTVHRCKGLEYDEVQLTSDFVTREKVEEWGALVAESGIGAGELARLNEEINLLYVALTRAKFRLHLPELSRPAGFTAQPPILPYYGRGGTVLMAPAPSPTKPARRPWTPAEDFQLT